MQYYQLVAVLLGLSACTSFGSSEPTESLGRDLETRCFDEQRTTPKSQAAHEAVTKLSAVTILTDNFDAMVSFYQSVFGFELVAATGGYAQFENTPLAIAERQTIYDASGYKGFIEPVKGQRFELAFEVSEPALVDEVYLKAISFGANSILPPENKPWGQRVAFFVDPDGNVHDVFSKLDLDMN